MKKNSSKTNPVGNEKPVVIDFGPRAVSDQNFSKMVAVPKRALANCGNNVKKVNVELVQDGSEKYLRLKPILEEA